MNVGSQIHITMLDLRVEIYPLIFSRDDLLVQSFQSPHPEFLGLQTRTTTPGKTYPFETVQENQLLISTFVLINIIININNNILLMLLIIYYYY
jgi:hypothetical protein